jgi:hypothetical protein
MSSRLKVYRGPEEEDTFEESSEPTVRVRLGDLIPLVAVAQRLNFLWLKDFLEDEVAVSEDLYEVMQAFRNSRPVA